MNHKPYIHWLPALDDTAINGSPAISAKRLHEWGVPGIAGFMTTPAAWHEARQSSDRITPPIRAALEAAYQALSQQGFATVQATAAHHRLDLWRRQPTELPDSQALIEFCRNQFNRSEHEPGDPAMLMLVARQWPAPSLVGIVRSEDRQLPGAMLIEARRCLDHDSSKHDHYRVFKPLLKATGRTPIIESHAPAADQPGARSTAARRFLLDADEVLTLAQWASQIEAHIARPVRMEWMRGQETAALYVLAVHNLPLVSTDKRRPSKPPRASKVRLLLDDAAQARELAAHAAGTPVGWASLDHAFAHAGHDLIETLAEAAAQFAVLAYPAQSIVGVGTCNAPLGMPASEILSAQCRGVYRARAEMGLENLAVGLDAGAERIAIGDAMHTMARHGLIRGETGLRLYLRWRTSLDISAISRFCDGIVLCDSPLPALAVIESLGQQARTHGIELGVCLQNDESLTVAQVIDAGATWIAARQPNLAGATSLQPKAHS